MKNLYLKHRTLFWYLLGLIALCFLFYFMGRKDEIIKVEYKTITKIERYIDSVKTEVKSKEKEVDKITKKVSDLKIKTPTYPPVCDIIIKYKDSIINYQDTIILKKDSIIYIYKEIDLKKDEIIEIQKKYYPKRIGIGIQIGTTYIDNSFKPYLGAGISYNLFNF